MIGHVCINLLIIHFTLFSKQVQEIFIFFIFNFPHTDVSTKESYINSTLAILQHLYFIRLMYFNLKP